MVSGVEADIPEVDIFIAGTSCVDFSNLNTRKSKEFENLKKSNKDWRQLFQQRGDGQLSRDDIDDAEWQSFISSMLQDSDKRTSTTTFAAAINYLRERQPKIVIFENVETAPWESTADYVFPLSGYSIKIVKLDTKHYYLPQTRSRKYVIGFNHKFFGVDVARALCDMAASKLKAMEYTYSCNVTDFLLPVNSIELHRARNEMELTALSAQERDVDWSFSKSRHETFRDTHSLGDSRPWIQWRENGNSNAPDKMWKPWEARQPNRVSDLLDCAHLAGTKGKIPKHGAYDLRHKAQIIDCSQNVDRVNLGPDFGITNCLTPNAIPVLTLEARPITGTEALKLQGLPIENFDMSVETQAQLQDLAGNAMTTTVVGATLLASLSSVARYSSENNLGWLSVLFPKGDYQDKTKQDTNSYKAHTSQLGKSCDDDCVLLSRLFQADHSVSNILDLGSKTRRRCVCYHILAYSSMELYVCQVCGASVCKSCKGNPEHQLVKSAQSFEDMGCLSFAEAEFRLREFFPAILPMLSNIDHAKVVALNRVLSQARSATYSADEAEVLASETLAGLCSTVYALKFVEITDITRIQYVSEDNFMLQVNIERDQIVWYLYLDQWSEAAKKLRSKHKSSEPVARAILGPDANCQFPTSWEPWIPHNIKFKLSFRLEGDSSLRLLSSGVEGIIMDKHLQDDIMRLDNTVWVKHEECGFPESAFWVTAVGDRKLFLFKDVNPIGEARMDEFIITTVSRDMGRTPVAETRSVLLRIPHDSQLHQIIDNMVSGSEFMVPGYITGWWLRGEEVSLSIPEFWQEGSLAEQPFPRSLPVRIHSASQDPYLASHNGQSPCSRDQILLEFSLPIFGASRDAVAKVLETLRDLDMAQQLDRAEFVRIIGPCYQAVERHILSSCKGSRIIQLWEVELVEDCEACAPRLPAPIWERQRVQGSRSGPVAARYREEDQQVYELNLRKQPVAFRIDHNVDAALSSPHNKDQRFSYVDVRFVGRAHTLLQQARSYLPNHPDFHKDTVVTKGTFSMEFCVLEDPRPELAPIRIQPPMYNKQMAQHPTGFRQDMRLFDEQLASLEWMIARENDDNETQFVEREVAEVYMDHLRIRFFAQSARQITRRGRVVADNVGFGKTAVCLGLIDRQHQADRGAFMDMRAEDPSMEDMIHLQATLVVVPNQLTKQWKKEGERFLNAGYNIIVISTFNDLQSVGVAGLRQADIVICSNRIFQDRKYSSLLFEICGSGELSVNHITESPKVYRAWYKTALKIISSVRRLMIKVLTDSTNRQDHMNELRRHLTELREQGTTESRLAFMPSSSVEKLRPMVLLELFSFSRVIWDEFPYKNLQVTEFVAHCPTISKWMLSGTPPLDSLGDIANVAYLFNVHLARPLALVGGRQPCVCENPPIEPLSEIEQTAMYHSRYSPSLLKERHAVALDFVRKFMRKNTRVVDVKSVTKPVVLSSLPNSRIAYLELQQELNNRTFNANRAAAEVRNRLMSRISWKGTRLGTERAMEALMLRASSSYKDVRNSLAGKDLSDTASVAEIADALHQGFIKAIRDMEDRGRELLGKAFYLAYRLAFVNVKKHAKKKDNGEDRQSDYFEKLQRIVNSILDVNVTQFSGWDAYESALRILIWNDELCENLGDINDAEEPLTGLPSTSDPEAWKNVVQKYWEQMSFCDLPGQIPEPEDQARVNILTKKQQRLLTFTKYLAKTPLHSRRWFYAHKLESSGNKSAVDLPLIDSLLEMEWTSKVPWERQFRDANGDSTSDLVPIRELVQSAWLPTDGAYSLQLLVGKDTAREAGLAKTRPETRASLIQEVEAKHPHTRLSRAHWQEECGRRGLVFKSTENAPQLQERLCLAMENKATEKDYITPDGCPLQVVEMPVEGKQRIRGSDMEPTFDQLMNTIDKLLDHLARLPEVYGKRNLQKIIALVARGAWRCVEHGGDDALQTHCVSLACGHVHCALPSDPKGVACGVRGCTSLIKSDTCVLLRKLSEEPRAILAADFDEGALRKDPGAYLDEDDESQSPKTLAIINLINSTSKSDQVVVFVQNVNLQNDLYKALASVKPKINYVTDEELTKDEAGALEAFKAGHDDDDNDSSSRGPMKKVLVQTISSEQAAGSNLHNANHVVFASPLVTRNQREWDAQMQQALGRCVRYRQHKTVHVYHFVVDETIEADTLEWRLKKEMLVRPGRAVGRFREGITVPDFLERFDADEQQRGEGCEDRAVSMLSRDDVRFLMGDDYISVAAARSAKTVESARVAALEEVVATGSGTQKWTEEKKDAQMIDAEEDVALDEAGGDSKMTGA